MRSTPLAAVLLFVACGGGGTGTGPGWGSSLTLPPSGTSSSGAPDDTSTSSTAAGDSTAASTSGLSGSASSGGPGGLSDLGTPPDFGDGPPPGCGGKVDFVFTISSNHTMEFAQAALKDSFPGFMATLEQEFADFDYHILSANSRHTSWGLGTCEGCLDTCPAGPPDYPCDVKLQPCDTVNGAGITFPAGWNASNERCELASQQRYITPGEPDLLAAFTCIASVGTNGTGEVAQGTLAALAEEINWWPNGCNAGFLRPDALLVVVAIEDTADEFSPGEAKDWADALLAAKGGDGDAVVLLVISTDIDVHPSVCGYDPPNGKEHKLRSWTELVPHGIFGSVCAPSYAPFFAEAAARIKAQCDVFVPQ